MVLVQTDSHMEKDEVKCILGNIQKLTQNW